MRGVIHSGYCSVQPGDAITWKRRYFELGKAWINFYKDEKVCIAVES